jgi:hypothetical protein
MEESRSRILIAWVEYAATGVELLAVLIVRAQYPGTEYSLAFIVALLVSVFGILALFAVFFRQ